MQLSLHPEDVCLKQEVGTKDKGQGMDYDFFIFFCTLFDDRFIKESLKCGVLPHSFLCLLEIRVFS